LVATWRHEAYRLGEFEREVLRHVDGPNNRRAIVSRVMEAVRAGALTVEVDGRPIPNPEAGEPLVGRFLEEVLGRLVRYSLLAAPVGG
jgi:methyltransferase-like protein